MSDPARMSWRWLAALMLCALVARGVACWQFSHNLSDDRDVYLAIAQGIHDGHGFSVPGSTTPTAFRPPLYPLLLSPISGASQASERAVLHAVLGAVMTAAVVWLAALSGLSVGRQAIAGLIAACDPLLVYYSSLPMTETLAAAASALLLATGAAACKSSSVSRRSLYSALGAVAFGGCVMTRPTYWAFTGVVVVFGVIQVLRGAPQGEKHPPRALDWFIGGMLTVVCVAPWPIRNQLALGHPILTTTHGGYTLLLANNEAYYREVVDQPLGTVWDGSHGAGQEAWVESVEAEIRAAGVTGEVERDRWMKDRGWRTIREQPATFLKACGRRFLSFWSLRPHADSASAAGRVLAMASAVWYAALWIALAKGSWNAIRRGGCAVELSLLLVAAFVAVHLVYWTDARMRAPIVPAIAVLAARAGWKKRDENGRQ